MAWGHGIGGLQRVYVLRLGSSWFGGRDWRWCRKWILAKMTYFALRFGRCHYQRTDRGRQFMHFSLIVRAPSISGDGHPLVAVGTTSMG